SGPRKLCWILPPHHIPNERTETRDIVLAKRNRSAKVHHDDPEPRHPVSGVESFGRAARNALGYCTAEVLHQSCGCDIDGAQLAGLEDQATEEMKSGRGGRTMSIGR